MGAMRILPFASLCLVFANVDAALKDGLYITNGTDILYNANPVAFTSIYKQTGTIVGLAYDRTSGILFWSTVDIMTRGIYRGVSNNGGSIQNITKIVENDVLEVNSLTFDWISKHIYWTDSRKRTIEVSDPDGSNRRILVMSGLLSPRGIYASPDNGYLFWTDQGHKHIMRSRLDGSEQTLVTKENVGLPNQIIVSGSKLYWVDSEKKTFESALFSNGAGRSSIEIKANGASLGSNEHIFGLAIGGHDVYVTKWNSGKLIKTDLYGGNQRLVDLNLGPGKVFSAVFVHIDDQNPGTDPCGGKGCKGLCLPKSISQARCSCPSYGGKTLSADKKSCTAPSNVLLYAVGSSGYVCFRDPDAAASEAEVYVVGRSLRPVAVAYDSVSQVVYWSDVRERTIHSAKIDGTNPRILLGSQNGIGLVEGMVIDTVRRQLFYTNIGSVLLEGVPYSWHRVETFRLDTTLVKVKTLVTTADKPRGVALDSGRGHLYYTDWGSRASVVRVDLDGSNPTLIRTGLDNPNGIAIHNDHIYFVDSHYKTRNSQSGAGGGGGGGGDRYPSTPKNGSLYRMKLDGSEKTDLLKTSSKKLLTPFGLSSTPSGDLYVSDWGQRSLNLFKNSLVRLDELLSETEDVMSVQYSQYSSSSQPGASDCATKPCSDLCLARNATETQCTCNSYSGKALSGPSCQVPQNFILVADMNSIKIVSLDEQDSNPYIAAQGNPYFSNYAALTFDPSTKIVYYSDVNRRAIRALHLVNMTTEVVHRVNNVIDGLAFHDGKLFWTDYTNGRISELDITGNIGNTQSRVLLRNLKRPRGIRIYKNYIYWTEWGEAPRLARNPLGSYRAGDLQVLFDKSKSDKITWPNGIYIDETKDRLYLVDGNTKVIFNCSLEGDCQELPGAETVLKHAYDIWFIGEVFYYSDWKSGAINAFNPNNPSTTWKVVGDLMRPTQMYIERSSSTRSPTGCSSAGSCSGGECVPLIVNSVCDCKDKAPSSDGKTCTTSPGTCSHNGNMYKSGQEFTPRPCINCQCVGAVSYVLDPSYNDSLCRRIECPPLDCPTEDIKQPSGNECCPTCTKCGIRITNCPKDTTTLNLPSDFGFVVHDFLPSVRDCRGLSREISFVKDPVGAIYRRGVTRVSITANAKSPVDSNKCSYSVDVKDVTPPTITCPRDLQLYAAEGSSIPAKWESPTAFDNVGLNEDPVPSVAWGSNLGVGVHRVTYTATDSSGLKTSCSFNVRVNLIKKEHSSCQMPSILGADLHCSETQSTGSSLLTCNITCTKDFVRKKNSRSSLICQMGNWTQLIDTDLLHHSCIKEKQRAWKGELEILSQNTCSSGGIDLNYAKEILLYSVKKDFVRLTDIQPTVTVECDPNSKDLKVKVILSGQGGETVKGEINDKLDEIQKELERGFLKVNYRDNSGIHSAQSLNFDKKSATAACLSGQYLDNEKCVVCSPGSYQHQSDKCRLCEVDTYNDLEGQTQCKNCPEGSMSEPGAYIVDQCKRPIDTSDPTLILYIAIGAAALLILLIIIIVVVVARRRNQNRSKRFRRSMDHPNKAYGCADFDDETYDKIAEPGLGDNGTVGGGNHYEMPQSGGAAPNDYDTIGVEAEGGCCEGNDGGGRSPGGSTSSHSTPSYLQPKSTPPYLTPVM